MPIPRTSFWKRRQQRSVITKFRLWHLYVVCIASFLPFNVHPCHGLKIISSSTSPTYAAVGDSVTLSCHFNLSPEDLGVLDIEWSIRPSDVHGKDANIIWCSGDRIYDGDDPFKGRVQFVSPDPASGNASITITDLTPTDTNTVQCKVRKVPGIAMINVRLHVMEKPALPECNLEGVVELGHKVVLKCRSTQGSPPVWFRWSKLSRDKILPNDAYVDSVQGDLFLTVTREDVLGTYVCTAQNLVGMDTCLLTIKFNSAVNTVAATAAAVIVPMAIIIVIIFVFCHKKRKIGQHSDNDILEDEMPPHKWLPQRCQQVIPSISVQNLGKVIHRDNGKTLLVFWCFIFCRWLT